MDVREKLVEMMCDVLEDGCIGHCNHPPCWKVTHAVDGLIANGVTVQEWISVEDRLPEAGECVIVYDTREDYIGMWEFSGVAWYNDDYNPLGIDEVTRWMPLPQPPKGE